MRTQPRIAIVSDALVQRGGAERVVDALARAFPDAPIYALLYSPETGPPALKTRVRASWLNRVPSANRRHRMFLPFYRLAIESLDLSDFDIILSSHHSVGKGVLTRADQLHICYCHTPMRALWERSAAELATVPMIARPAAAALFSHLRAWDAVTASRVQHYIANSRETQRRIATYYRRESTIVPPPIETEFFTPGGVAEDYYLVASRPVPYKRIDIAIEATGRLNRRLKIVGGKHAIAGAPRHVELLGSVSDEELRTLMRGARGLLFPQFEDFGMAPLEVNSCGRPVIAFGRGGALETVIDGETGILAPEQTVESFVDAIERLECTTFDAARMRAHAKAFSSAAFIGRMRSLVASAWEAHTLWSHPERTLRVPAAHGS
jgi:glycosyltransferase involved in cell wall biosynthesis